MLCDDESPLLAARLGLGAIENPMRNSSGPPALDRLTDVPYLQVSQIQFAIGASHGQVTQFADRIERAVIVATVRVVIGDLAIGRHGLACYLKECHWKPFLRSGMDITVP